MLLAWWQQYQCSSSPLVYLIYTMKAVYKVSHFQENILDLLYVITQFINFPSTVSYVQVSQYVNVAMARSRLEGKLVNKLHCDRKWKKKVFSCTVCLTWLTWEMEKCKRKRPTGYYAAMLTSLAGWLSWNIMCITLCNKLVH